MSQNAYRNRSAHIAFMAIPAHGHTNPSLGLVSELVSRGHRVTYGTTEEFADQIGEAGASPVLFTTVLPSPSDPNQQWPEDLAEVQQLFLAETMHVIPQAEAAYADDRPDLIVYDIGAFHAPILALKWGIPYIQLSPTHVSFDGMEEEFDVRQSPELDAVHANYDTYLAEQGVDLTFDTLVDPRRSIVTIPRSFQYRGDTVASQYSFVGPMLTDRAFQGTWQAPEGRKVLLISLGSAYTDQLDFYRRCIAAYAESDWHVVMSVGRKIDPAQLGMVPPNFEVYQWIPQLRMLSQAHVFLTHAGMGGTTEGLYYGVPLIAAPQAAEQFANAARIEELGLGRQIDTASVTVDELREVLSEVSSDEAMRVRLKEMRTEIHTSGGVHRAVEIVEEQLGD